MEEFEKQEVRNSYEKQFSILMKEARAHIVKGDEESKKFYELHTHWYLEPEEDGWELLFPLDKQEWPTNFKNSYLQIEDMQWPQYTNYCYLMDILAPPFIPFLLLYFGYAVVEGVLIKTSFFVIQKMVNYQIMPQGMVVDPLAEYHGIKPSFYVGIPVPNKKYVEDWMITRQNPLEMYMIDVQKKKEIEHKEKLRNSYFESYCIQMAYAPGWFSDQLLEFSKEEKLHIPKQGWQ